MKYSKILITALALASLITSPAFAGDTLDRAVQKLVQGSNKEQPVIPMQSIFGHALIDFDNNIRITAWDGTLKVKPDATHVLTFPGATGVLAVNGTTSSFVFEGATADAYETTVSVTDPTADRAFVLPNAVGGTLMYSSLATNGTDVANSIWGVSNGLFFEGATADAHEIRLTPADATADVIYLFPDAAAGSYAVVGSTLATNAPDIANSVTGASNGLVWEGTADAFETTVAATDATADTTLTLPAKTASGTVETISVEAEAATDTITAGQLYGSVITNTGAVGAAVYTLPAPAVGMHVRVYLTVAQDVDINPADGTTILALTNAAGDAISSAATIGNCIELVALSTTTWAAFAVSGTWTDVN